MRINRVGVAVVMWVIMMVVRQAFEFERAITGFGVEADRKSVV